MVIRVKKQSDKKQPHLIIDAGPGCGKTTSAVAGLKMRNGGQKPDWYDTATDEQKAFWEAMDGVYSTIAFQAFNRSIASEIAQKVPESVQAKTFHASGLAMLKDAGYKVKGGPNTDQYNIKDAMGYGKDERMKKDDFKLSLTVSKVLGLLKNNLLEATLQNVQHLCDYYDIETKAEDSRITSMCSDLMKHSLEIKKGEFTYISFDDMLWLPVMLNLDATFDLLICDESQDLNAIQHELVCRTGCRLICIGDPRQAIYGFRGADSESMMTLQKLLEQTDRGVEVMPLQVSFRLPKSGVTNVQEYAPNLRAMDDAIEGTIEKQYVDEIKPVPGDLIVSRINANIFSMAFGLMKKRVPVRIQGRDFAQQLIKLLKSKCNRNDKIESVLQMIGEFDIAERERLEKKTFAERQLFVHGEKISCLLSIASDCNTMGEMLDIIETLFSDELRREDVVLLSTIHQAKGLESRKVYFLEPELVPHPMAKTDREKKQEYNLKFVAETRHMESLIYVSPRVGEDDRDFVEGRVVTEGPAPHMDTVSEEFADTE